MPDEVCAESGTLERAGASDKKARAEKIVPDVYLLFPESSVSVAATDEETMER